MPWEDFRIRRPLLEYTQRSIYKDRNICFEFTQMQGSHWLSGIHFIAKDFFAFLSKSQDFQSKHKGKDWRLVSNLRLRISSLSLRAPWTYKKLWTLQCIFLACLKTLSFAVTICYIYMLKCSYMSIFFKILFIISSHTFQTFWSAVCYIAWIGSA